MHRVVFMLAVAAAGVLCALAVSAEPTGAPGALSPADGADAVGDPVQLSWRSPDGAQPHLVRWAIGEPGAEPSFLPAPPGHSSVLLPGPFAADTHVYWAVQAQGGPWSETADFWVERDIVPPDPPTDLAALGAADGVELRWTASPSADAEEYRLYIRPEGGVYGNAASLGGVVSTRVSGLEPGLGYDFMLTAVDAAGNESTGVVAAWRPGARVTLHGVSYFTLQSAADAAAPGDTIELAEGTFLEGVSLPPGVSLRGAGPGRTILDAAGFAAGVTLESGDGSEASLTVVSNLTIRGGAAGIRGGVARVRLENVVVCRSVGPGIRVDAGLLEAVRITVFGCAQDGVDTGASGLVTDAIIARNGGAGVRARGAAGFRLSWSDLYDNTLGPTAGQVSTGDGLVAVAAQFEGEAADDFRVRAGDATVDAGDPSSPWSREPAPNGARVNLGAYGNTDQATQSLGEATGARVSSETSAGSASSKSDKYCVVSTAAYGGDGVSRVEELRRLRDGVLRSSEAGQAAVGTYEAAAAPVARRIRQSETLKALVRGALGK